MSLFDNKPRIYIIPYLRTAFLLLVANAITLPKVYAQNKDTLLPTEQTQTGAKDAGLQKQYDGWGSDQNGLRTRLFPAQKEYIVGQPAKFRLEMKNFGVRERMFDPQRVDTNNSMQVFDSDGKPAPYVAGGAQTGGSSKSIAPGRTVVLFDGFDLTDQYLFVKPGSYTFQFRGTNVIWKSESAIPPSNKITIDMRPGMLPLSMQVPARLIGIIPENWNLRLNRRVYEVDHGKITPPGWESGDGTYIYLERYASKRDGGLGVPVWVAEHRLAWTGNVLTWTGKDQTKKAIKPGEAATYVGKGADGYVYMFISEKAEKEWPDIRTKVRDALQIEPTAHGTSVE